MPSHVIVINGIKYEIGSDLFEEIMLLIKNDGVQPIDADLSKAGVPGVKLDK